MRCGSSPVIGKPVSDLRYERAAYCWPWAWSSAPVFLLSTIALRMRSGDGWLWKVATLLTPLSGAILSVAAVAGAALSLAAHWACLREQPPTVLERWQRAYFVLGCTVLMPMWLWSGYWTALAMIKQHIVFGRPLEIVALTVEPRYFLLSLTIHAVVFITIPVYWMAQAHEAISRRTRDATTHSSNGSVPRLQARSPDSRQPPSHRRDNEND